MYELIHLKGNSYYIKGHTNMGLYLWGEEDAVLIDSGIDDRSAEGAYAAIESLGRRLRLIISTHANSDHIGGNRRLIELTGCEVCAQSIERTFMIDQHLNTSLVWGGYPLPELFNKFFFAAETPVTPLEEVTLPSGLEIVSLPGHYVGMIGIATDDGVLYCADALSGEELLARSHITYIHDVGKYLDTVERLSQRRFLWTVPSHGEPSEDISALCRANRDNVEEVCRAILSVISDGEASVDETVARLFAHWGLRTSPNQYALVISTLRSYLSYLVGVGRVCYTLADGRLLWRAGGAE